MSDNRKPYSTEYHMEKFDEAEFMKMVNQVNWKQFPGPEYYKPDSVVDSLNNLFNLNEEKDKWNVYNEVLFAVGNNHAGTYYPVIIEVLPLLMLLLRSSKQELVINCILEILSDWYYSFGPETGKFDRMSSKEIEDFVRTNIRQLITGTPWNDSDRNMMLVSDLMNYFKENTNSD